MHKRTWIKCFCVFVAVAASAINDDGHAGLIAASTGLMVAPISILKF